MLKSNSSSWREACKVEFQSKKSRSDGAGGGRMLTCENSKIPRRERNRDLDEINRDQIQEQMCPPTHLKD